jgi:hypothetical protein
MEKTMWKKVIFIVFLVSIFSFSCNKKNEINIKHDPNENISMKEQPKQKISLEEKINEFSEKTFNSHEIFVSGVKNVTEFKNRYLNFYGECKNDIFEKFGTGYDVHEVDTTPLFYDVTERITYPGIVFYVYRDNDDVKSYIISFEIWRSGEKYFGDIAINCDLYTIIKQLGKPTKIENNDTLFYDVTFGFKMLFKIDNEYKLEKITVWEDLI